MLSLLIVNDISNVSEYCTVSGIVIFLSDILGWSYRISVSVDVFVTFSDVAFIESSCIPGVVV